VGGFRPQFVTALFRSVKLLKGREQLYISWGCCEVDPNGEIKYQVRFGEMKIHGIDIFGTLSRVEYRN
jgi:hypothetical protein